MATRTVAEERSIAWGRSPHPDHEDCRGRARSGQSAPTATLLTAVAVPPQRQSERVYEFVHFGLEGRLIGES